VAVVVLAVTPAFALVVVCGAVGEVAARAVVATSAAARAKGEAKRVRVMWIPPVGGRRNEATERAGELPGAGRTGQRQYRQPRAFAAEAVALV